MTDPATLLNLATVLSRGAQVRLLPGQLEAMARLLLQEHECAQHCREKHIDRATPEQEARDLLERAGVEDAQAMTSGSLVEIANLIVRAREP